MWLLLLVASQALAAAPRPKVSTEFTFSVSAFDQQCNIQDLDQQIWGLSLGALGRAAGDQQAELQVFFPALFYSLVGLLFCNIGIKEQF